MIASGMRAFHGVERMSWFLKSLPSIRPHVAAAASTTGTATDLATGTATGAGRRRAITPSLPRRCLCVLVENRERQQVRVRFGKLQPSLQLSKLVFPGSGREFSTSCNPLQVEIKQGQHEDRLIYNGPLTKMVCLVKFFSLSTSIISAGLITTLFISNDGGVLTYVAGGISSLMIFTPIILHWFTKGYVTQLYYNHTSNTYTACTFDFFLRNLKTEFKQSDVSLPSVTSAISSFSIHNKPVLVDPRGFISPNHYSYLMGYADTDGNVTMEKKSNSEESK